MAQAAAETCPRKQGPHTLGGALEAISEDAPDAIGRLLVERRTLERLIRCSKGYRTGLCGVAEMPDHTATDNRGQIHLVGKTLAVLFIGQEIDGQRQPTPRQHRHQALLTERTHHAIEGHRRDIVEDRA
jgi:hypothetical protein